MRWRRHRRAELARASAPEPDETSHRLAELAETWRQDPGVIPWPDEHTQLLPVITPAARHRGWGSR